MKLSRRTKLKSNTIASTLIVIGIIIVINIVSYNWFYRIDLTQNKEFSISETTKSTLKNLDDIVNIKVYFSEKLPPQYTGIAQEVKDVLEEYKNFSKGQLKITYIDPKDDADIKEDAARVGIPIVNFNITEKDKIQLTQGYLGLVVVFGDKKETLPVIEDTNNLEYKLTSAIKKVSTSKTNKIGFLQGHGEPSIEESVPGDKNMFRGFLQDQFDIVSVDTKLGQPIDEEIDTLVINGPKESFGDRELYLIDQFLMKGKSVLFLIDGVVLGEGLSAKSNDTNLEKLLSNYGINLKKNLVLDASHEIIGFSNGVSNFFAQYPFWVKVMGENLDKNNVIVSKLDGIVMPWVSSLSVDNNIVGDNTVSELVKSTKMAWSQDGDFNLDPEQKFSPMKSSFTQHTLAVAVNGKFNSYFTGKTVPLKDKDTAPTISSEAVVESTDKGRIIVVADSDFITEKALGRSNSNLIFFQNMIDVLTQDDNLVSIRAKGVTDRFIKEVDDSKKTFIKFINIFGATIFVLIVGLTRYVLRRRNRDSFN